MTYHEFIEHLKIDDKRYARCFEGLSGIESVTIEDERHITLYFDKIEHKKVEFSISFNEPKIYYVCAGSHSLYASNDNVKTCVEHKRQFYNSFRVFEKYLSL